MAAAVRPVAGWGWVTASGILSVIAGIVFLLGWPADSTDLLGLVLPVDLTCQVSMDLGGGIALKEIIE